MTPLLLFLTVGCSTDLTPSWAFDPIWIEPALAGGVHGFQTWQVYGPKWPKKYDDRHYVCSVVTEISGDPITCDAEPGCTFAWELAAAVLETDCSDPTLAEDPLFVSLARVALGGAAAGEDVPWPGFTSVGWADYGNSWEVHGDAYPEALDLGGTVAGGDWDEIQPFLMVPTQSWPLNAP